MLRQEAPHPVREVRPLVPRPRLAAEQEPKVEPEPGLLPPRAAPAPVAAAPRGCARRLAHEGGGVAAAPRRGTGGGGGEGARGGGVESGRRGHFPVGCGSTSDGSGIARERAVALRKINDSDLFTIH